MPAPRGKRVPAGVVLGSGASFVHLGLRTVASGALAALLVVSSIGSGVAGASGDAEAEMVVVAAGEFVRGSDRGDGDERPRRRVVLDAFAIDRFEVTQADYARCVQAGGCKPARRYPERVGSALPAIGVSWYDAHNYCRWAGKRLPTEAEWECAARGDKDRIYPWGDEPLCDRANFGNYQGAGLCAGRNPGHPVAVGKHPRGVSVTGAHDMAGNVWEWVADWYGPYAGQRRRNPAGARRGKQRVVRGGSCCSYFSMPRTTNRHRLDPAYEGDDVGFRCARALDR